MQNRLYAVVVLIIIGICCLGLYVAVSGFLNSNAPSLIATGSRTLPPLTPLVVVIATDTVAPTQPINPSAISPTLPPTLANIPISTLILPTATPAPPTPTSRPVTPTALPQPTPISACGNFQFCNVSGPPDTSLAPSSSTGCPANYIWGRVYDMTGKGIPDKKIRFRDPQGELGPAVTKNVPDVPGKYDIPVGAPGSSWVVWILGDDGSPASPQVLVTTQSFIGGSVCPNRIDFKQQR